MKTHSDFTRVSGTLVMALTALLLCQCSLPPRQAWQYIQSNGLLTYLNYSAGHSSPPFRSGRSYQPRYATRSYSRPSSTWYSNWSSGMPNRVHYSNTTPPSRYYTPAPSYRSSSPAPRPRVSEPAPRVTIPVDDSAPKIVKNESPSPSPSAMPSAPKNDIPSPAAPKTTGDLPYGSPVPGRANMVNSPYAGKTQLVDVSGMGPGQTVKCPYTGKLFKVPPTAQASNNAESKLEPKAEGPKPSDAKSEQ